MNKKYVLTDEIINHYGHVLHRIKAVRSFGNVKEGDLGGYIEKGKNLSHDDNCWIFGEAKVYDNAIVYGNALVSGYAKVHDNAIVGNYAHITGYAKVYDNAKVLGHARVYHNALVSGNAEINGNAKVQNNAWVFGDARVFGDADINCHTQIGGNAQVSSNDDYIVFKNFWSSGRYFTWTRYNDMWSVGCFYGTGEELIEKAYKDSVKSGKNYEAYVKFVEMMKQNEKSY